MIVTTPPCCRVRRCGGCHRCGVILVFDFWHTSAEVPQRAKGTNLLMHEGLPVVLVVAQPTQLPLW